MPPRDGILEGYFPCGPKNNTFWNGKCVSSYYFIRFKSFFPCCPHWSAENGLTGRLTIKLKFVHVLNNFSHSVSWDFYPCICRNVSEIYLSPRFYQGKISKMYAFFPFTLFFPVLWQGVPLLPSLGCPFLVLLAQLTLGLGCTGTSASISELLQSCVYMDFCLP